MPLTATSPDPHVLVLFGARGDLARRKLLPGLFRLAGAGLIANGFRIIGSGRHEPRGDFADEVRQALEEHFGGDLDLEEWEAFAGSLSFVTSSADDGADLSRTIQEAREDLGADSRTVRYMSVPPSAMQPMVVWPVRRLPGGAWRAARFARRDVRRGTS
ncbi:MAG: hypothetical protein WBP81_23500 [Solirubrobacteraceae bacterium]